MLWKPNFKNPTKEQYLSLLDDEIKLVQYQEILEGYGLNVEAKSVEAEKFYVRSKRKRMKKALNSPKVVPMKKAANL